MNTPSDKKVVMQCDSADFSLEALERQLDTGWLSAALSQRHPGVAVTRASVMKAIVGFQTKAWMDLEFNEVGTRLGLPNVMIVKSVFDRYEPTLSFSTEAEVIAYRDLKPRYALNTPVCYYAGYGPDNRAHAIILEDLCAKGVRFCHATRPFTYAEAAAIIDALARFHSLSWNEPSIWDENSILGRARAGFNKGIVMYLAAIMEPKVWDAAMAAPRGMAIPKRLHDRTMFASAYERLVEFRKTQPHAIAHGDEHPGNLYFERDGTPGFFDLNFRPGPWAQGIAYFIASALDVLDRREWDRALIAHYLARLQAYGVDAPPFEEAWDAYCRELLYIGLIWMANPTTYQTESVTTACTVRCITAMLDNDTFGRLGISIDQRARLS